MYRPDRVHEDDEDWWPSSLGRPWERPIRDASLGEVEDPCVPEDIDPGDDVPVERLPLRKETPRGCSIDFVDARKT